METDRKRLGVEMNFIANCKQIIKKLINLLGYELVTIKKFQLLIQTSELRDIIQRWTHDSVPTDLSLFVINNSGFFPRISQRQQDFLALWINAKVERSERFFVEFGATDGISYSNTFLLEKQFGFDGILAEPGKENHRRLHTNRNVAISHQAVWSESNLRINFLESQNSEYSTLSGFQDMDQLSKLRANSHEYEVDTISLEDLLVEYDAPRHISYLSIDTEGSEYEIIKKFNFDLYSFGFISIEHNFTANRELIYDLLFKSGYRRVLTEISQFDDWYVPEPSEHYFLV